MNHHVRLHDFLPESKHVRIAGVDGRAYPVGVGVAECCDSGEVLDDALVPGADERLVDAEDVRVAVDTTSIACSPVLRIPRAGGGRPRFTLPTAGPTRNCNGRSSSGPGSCAARTAPGCFRGPARRWRESLRRPSSCFAETPIRETGVSLRR